MNLKHILYSNILLIMTSANVGKFANDKGERLYKLKTVISESQN